MVYLLITAFKLAYVNIAMSLQNSTVVDRTIAFHTLHMIIIVNITHFTSTTVILTPMLLTSDKFVTTADRTPMLSLFARVLKAGNTELAFHHQASNSIVVLIILVVKISYFEIDNFINNMPEDDLTTCEDSRTITHCADIPFTVYVSLHVILLDGITACSLKNIVNVTNTFVFDLVKKILLLG